MLAAVAVSYEQLTSAASRIGKPEEANYLSAAQVYVNGH